MNDPGGRLPEETAGPAGAMMHLFAQTGRLRTLDPSDDRVQQQVQILRDFL